jgi:hypothetical protein
MPTGTCFPCMHGAEGGTDMDDTGDFRLTSKEAVLVRRLLRATTSEVLDDIGGEDAVRISRQLYERLTAEMQNPFR